jgi:hypothetical protein
MNVMMLAFESQQAICLRLARLASGGAAAEAEAARMISEKISAADAAARATMNGASADKILRAYRRKVRANIRRLSRASAHS